MKTFPLLSHAISYQRSCPICHMPLKVGGSADHTLSYDFNGQVHETLSWKEANIALEVNPSTNRVTMLELDNALSKAYAMRSGKSPYRANSTLSNKNGKLIVGLRMECLGCCQYYYILSITIDVAEMTIADTTLNSETLTFDDKERNTHEIRNIYSYDTTEYVKYHKYNNIKTGFLEKRLDEEMVTLPLIPLNLLEPEKTLERIKSLIMFL